MKKILKLLNKANESKFVTRKWNIVNQMRIRMWEMKLSIIQKFQNLIFVIATMLKF